MENQEDSIEKFCTVTNVSKEEARHLLEAFQWNYDDAIQSYFEMGGGHSTIPADAPQTEATQDNVGNSSTAVHSRSKPKVTGFDSIRSKSQNDPEEGQAFYVGGSERGGGGQQVLGPPRKNKLPDPNTSPDQFVHDLFSAAKGGGAEVLDTERCDSKPNAGTSRIVFSGTGYMLGEDPNQTSVVCPGPSSSVSGQRCGSPEEQDEKSVVVKMWRDGFSLDDGPLRSYTDPASQAFLEEIKTGHVPQELIKSADGGLVNLLLEDHHHEAWSAPPPPKVVPFSGKGMMLGHPTPRIVSSQGGAATNHANSPVSAPLVDESSSVTQMQVRLPEGQRLLVRLNHSHTIRDIRQAIISQHPNLNNCPFTIHTTYPSRILSDDNQTVEEAKLLNSALLVRLA